MIAGMRMGGVLASAIARLAAITFLLVGAIETPLRAQAPGAGPTLDRLKFGLLAKVADRKFTTGDWEAEVKTNPSGYEFFLGRTWKFSLDQAGQVVTQDGLPVTVSENAVMAESKDYRLFAALDKNGDFVTFLYKHKSNRPDEVFQFDAMRFIDMSKRDNVYRIAQRFILGSASKTEARLGQSIDSFVAERFASGSTMQLAQVPPANTPPPAATPAITASKPLAPPVASTPMVAAAGQPPRLALVVGNAAYGAAFGRLANPVNDANAIATALRASGFTVTVVTNGDQRGMKRAIAAFGQQLRAAGRGATGLFYFAGHGVQSRGVNYLVPVNAAIEAEADVDIEAVAADGVLRQMEEAGAATSIVILDACRNLPIIRSSRDGSRGLVRMEAPNGSFVAYSTAPGAIAADGSGGNSPFATALVSEMTKPGQPIEITFRNVRRAVMQATGGKQTPWDSSSLVDGFVFRP